MTSEIDEDNARRWLASLSPQDLALVLALLSDEVRVRVAIDEREDATRVDEATT